MLVEHLPLMLISLLLSSTPNSKNFDKILQAPFAEKELIDLIPERAYLPIDTQPLRTSRSSLRYLFLGPDQTIL